MASADANTVRASNGGACLQILSHSHHQHTFLLLHTYLSDQHAYYSVLYFALFSMLGHHVSPIHLRMHYARLWLSVAATSTKTALSRSILTLRSAGTRLIYNQLRSPVPWTHREVLARAHLVHGFAKCSMLVAVLSRAG